MFTHAVSPAHMHLVICVSSDVETRMSFHGITELDIISLSKRN